MADWDIIDAAEDSDDESGEEYNISDQSGEDLSKLGVAVIPVFDEVGRKHWQQRIFDAMDDFPEYKQSQKGPQVQRVLGGFGALGNPSSFHHPEVRVFRRMRKKLAFRPVMASFVKHAFQGGTDVMDVMDVTDVMDVMDVMIECLFDRICVRCEDFNRPVAESWHRDIYGAEKYKLRPLPNSLPGGKADILFGGWTNLDHREQMFVGLLSTHNESTAGKAGFSEFSKHEIQSFKFNERLQSQSNRRFGHTVHTDERGYIRVPPGHCILFQQQLIHSVVSGSQPDTPALRIFHGVRLTGETVPLFDISSAIENGGVPRIPSGQIPPMFSANHYQFFSTHERYRKWREQTFKRACMYERTTKENVAYYTPGSQGDRNRAANRGRYMPGLSEMGMWEDKYKYTERELRAMYPQRLFQKSSQYTT